MSQKPTKPSKSQELVKNLKGELQTAERNTERWRSDYFSKCSELDKAEAKIDAYERSEDFVRRILAEQNCNEIERLTNIIRWHIKPETAVIKKERDVPPSRF